MIDEIRRAAEPDIGGILNLLSQVLEVHAAIRPDLFITGKTKYTHDELREIIKDASVGRRDFDSRNIGFLGCFLSALSFFDLG